MLVIVYKVIMAIEFVVRPNRNFYPGFLELPRFADRAFNGNRHFYLTGIQRQRKKVRIIAQLGGPIRIVGNKWVEFVHENMYTDVHMLHFVQEGDDSFYVTGYDSKGLEVEDYAGVESRHIRFQSYRLPYPQFPQVIYNNSFFVYVYLRIRVFCYCVCYNC